jgi:hypothetical protein
MDTGDARIKVTVEPVLYAGARASQSPSKRPTRSASRTTTIPLRTGESSPTRWLRQPTPAAHIDSSGLDVTRRSSKKRKGTPGSVMEVVERRSSRRYARTQETRNEHTIEHDHAMDRAMFSEQSVPSSEVRRRRSLYPMRNQRSQRLSAARDDLDNALQAAIGGTSVASSDAGQDDYMTSDDVGAGAAGELTTANEDFTMITGESLASISFKANGTMLGSAAHDEDDEDDVEAEHLTSSPPQKVRYPDITEQADEAKTPMPNSHYDAIKWKPTGIEVKRLDLHEVQSNHDISESIEHGSDPHDAIVIEDDMPEPIHISPITETHSPSVSPESQDSARKSVPPKDATFEASNPDDSDADVVEDRHAHADEAAAPGAAEEVDDDDLWAEEASRDIDDSAITITTNRSRAFQRPRVTHTEVASKTATVLSVPSGQNDQPRRARLPRTWRRTGEDDSSRADSSTLSNNIGNDATNCLETITDQSGAPTVQRTSGDEGESERSSGVLTPPSTDDDDSRRKLHDVKEVEHNDAHASKTIGQKPSPHQDEVIDLEDEIIEEDEVMEDDEEEEDEGDISGFTNPGAADTQLEAHHRFGRQSASVDEEEEEEEGDEKIASPVSSPGESGEDTGYFWQSNLPQVYRSGKDKPKPQRKMPVDLSAILRMDSSKVEEDEPTQTRKPDPTPAPLDQARPRPNRQTYNVHRKPALVATRPKQVERSPDGANGHILPSPVRRSLLRASKVLDGGEPAQPPLIRRPTHRAPEPRIEETLLTATDDSLASKDADQQQLLGEMRATTPVAKKPAHERLAVLKDTSQPAQGSGGSVDASYEETDTTFKNSWPEHSYEEHLNIESPQKIGVNFNDSTLSFRNEQQQQQQPRPNLLAPRGPIKALFEKSANAQASRPAVAGKHNVSPGPPNTNLVGAPKPASTYTQQENEGVFTRLSTTFWSAVARPQGPPPTPAPFARTTEQTISLSLRAQLRSRYGVLPNSHPWTMAHMRTLHRMLNSLESGRRDSIVPTHSPLPAHLTDIIGEGRLSATGRSFRFEQSHACVVQAFLQLLVTPALFQSMEKGEVEWLGDAQAAHLRGEMGGRPGNDLCFKTLKPKRGLIAWEWIVECLGCCVVSNVEMGMRRVAVKVRREEIVRDVEMSVMGDGQGDGRVREWFERDGVRTVV